MCQRSSLPPEVLSVAGVMSSLVLPVEGSVPSVLDSITSLEASSLDGVFSTGVSTGVVLSEELSSLVEVSSAESLVFELSLSEGVTSVAAGLSGVVSSVVVPAGASSIIVPVVEAVLSSVAGVS